MLYAQCYAPKDILTHYEMTNFRLFKLKEFTDDNFKFDENGRKLSKQVEKTVGKGEIARYEQFLHCPQCFQKACFPGVSKGVIVWDWVNPFPNKPWFLRVYGTTLLKTLWEKEKMLVTSIFSFSHSVFYSVKEINHHFSNIQIVVCKCFQFGHVQNSVVWERVKPVESH